MKKILHFHPNAFYAKKFVKPLIDAERKCGFLSNLATDKNNCSNDYLIKFSITFNPVSLLFRFLKLSFFLYKKKPDIIVAHNQPAILPICV